MAATDTTDVNLRSVERKFWQRVKVQAARDGVTVKTLILKLCTDYLVKREGKSQ